VATAAHTQHAADENRQALMLCTIVVIFFICNFPRSLISLYESIHHQVSILFNHFLSH
jgi:hypothetical protein